MSPHSYHSHPSASASHRTDHRRSDAKGAESGDEASHPGTMRSFVLAKDASEARSVTPLAPHTIMSVRVTKEGTADERARMRRDSRDHAAMRACPTRLQPVAALEAPRATAHAVIGSTGRAQLR